ncbi:uncharacterized protein K02A2.6-like [Tripterygium wilfordii]|uniref:uncharacterized protein K02A2.6-like n=1 Tax=Tripterygium wilfordii TaxID=458696 RepID=UPI0018F7EE86|nr:uncharacterized protein K02A2.6-like [Tripterygium wilfordii]
MPFGLKNAGATYQRLVNRMFASLLGKSMEVYIDDMLVKTLKAEDHIEHLKQAFEILDAHEMKLNPLKCVFGVKAGKFLGFIITQRHIEANPDQIQAILNIPSPTNIRDVQLLLTEENNRQHAVYYVSRSLLDAKTSPGMIDNAQKELCQNNENDEAIWQLFVDGSTNAKGNGLGIILISPQGDRFSQAINQVLREENQQADALANLGSAIQVQKTLNIPLIYLESSAINKHSMVEQSFVITEDDDDWRTSFIQYLQDDVLPQDKNEARALQHEAQYALAELHEGIYENHSGGQSLASKVMQTGYYWPTLRGDAAIYVAKCDKCQRFSQIPHQPPTELVPISSVWPFMRWEMDIVGKVLPASGQRVFLLILTDYFTKWVEAEAYKQVRDKEVKSFIWRNIICRFGVPSEIICDNGSQFISHKLQDFCNT